jgi:hypothetical protein
MKPEVPPGKWAIVVVLAAAALALGLIIHLFGDLSARVHTIINTPLEAQP